MIPVSILFYWSKGAETRRKIMFHFVKRMEKNKPVFLNELAKSLKMSHVAVRKHLQILVDEGYVRQINPGSRPVFLELTSKGIEVAEQLFSKK